MKRGPTAGAKITTSNSHSRIATRFRLPAPTRTPGAEPPPGSPDPLDTRVGLHAYATFDQHGSADGFACVKTGPSTVRAGWLQRGGRW